MPSIDDTSGEKQFTVRNSPSGEQDESTRDRILDLLLDRIFAYSLAALFIVLGAVLEWLRWHFDAPPQPVLWTMLALIALTVALWKIIPYLRELKAINSSRAGGKWSEQLKFTCLDCGQKLKASGDRVGEIIECSHCGKPQTVPARGE